MRWFWMFVIIAVQTGCAAAGVHSDENAGSELCEIEFADSHVPNVKFFYQDVSKPDKRLYECTLLVEDATEISSKMRLELEPWCRAKICLAMSASAKCSGTKFADGAHAVPLLESLHRGDVGTSGSLYLLVGETAN